MSVIVLTAVESKKQIIAGFPEYVTFSTNIPATIFYTLDGTEPTDDSQIAVGPIYIPTTGKKVTLKAFARTASVYSETLEFDYCAEFQDLDRTRRVDEEGLNILPPCDPVVDSLSKDIYGNPTQETSIPFQDLEMVASETNSIGEKLQQGTSLPFINKPSIKLGFDTTHHNKISSVLDGYFDPSAGVILIDGSTPENLANQVVKIINRPYNSMDTLSKQYNQMYYRSDLVTANYVRTHTNLETGKSVAYYFDSRECRWIMSTQLSEQKRKTLDWGENNFSFQWITEPSMTKLF